MISGQILDGKNIIGAENLLQSEDLTIPSIQSIWGTNSDSIVINSESELPIIKFTDVTSYTSMGITNNCDFDILVGAICFGGSMNAFKTECYNNVVSASDVIEFEYSLSGVTGIGIIMITRLSAVT